MTFMRNARHVAAILLALGCLGRSAGAAARPACAVLTFDAKGGVTKEEASLLSDRFAIEFDRLGQFTLISRAKMTEVLDLNKFSTSAYYSGAEGAIEAGKLLAVQYMVYGSIGRIGTLYTVNAYLANVESGATERTAITDQRGNIEDLLTSAMARTARSLLNGPSAGDTLPAPPAEPEPPDAAPPAGCFRIDVYPGDAEIRLNGFQVEAGPVEAPAGSHTISAVAAGFEPHMATYKVAAGATVDVDIVLMRLPERKPAKETLRRPRVH